MKLLIRNLARTTTEAELRAMFEAYGTVQSCSLVMDKVTGNSKGFGFVEMPKPGDARAAMKHLNGIDVAGSKIRVKKAEEHTEAEQPAATSQAQPPARGSKKADAAKSQRIWPAARKR